VLGLLGQVAVSKSGWGHPREVSLGRLLLGQPQGSGIREVKVRRARQLHCLWRTGRTELIRLPIRSTLNTKGFNTKHRK